MNLQNNNFQKRSLSPIISVILLVLVAAILTGAILSWSKNTVKEKLDVSKENLKQASDIDCINSNFYVESCKIDFFTKEISLLVINNSLLNYGNLVLTVNGQSFDGSDIKLYGNFETSVLAGASVNLLTSSNFSFKDESSFDSLDPYNIKNISLVSSTCPNSPIVFSNCDVTYGGGVSYFRNYLFDFSSKTDNNLSYILRTMDSTQINLTIDKIGNGNRNAEEGKSYYFDGIDDYLELPVNELESFTISSWVKLPDPTRTYYGLLSSYQSSNYGIAFLISNGKLKGYVGNGSSENSFLATHTDIRDDSWHHIAYTYAPGERKLYLDGIVVGQDSLNVNIDWSQTSKMYIGVGPGDEFSGGVFDFRIYNTNLSEDNINNIKNFNYNDTNRLVAQYKMDENFGTIAYDSSGNGAHVQITQVENGNFELETLYGWRHNGTGNAVVVYDPDFGSHVAYIPRLGGLNNFYGIAKNGSPFTTGKTYHLSLKYKGNTDKFRMVVSGGLVIGGFIGDETLREFSTTFTATGTGLYLTFDNENDTSKYMYLDNVVFYEITSPFFNTQSVYSWQNSNGYSKDGNVFIPRDESNQTKDVLGNNLENTGRAKYNLELKNSYAGTVFNDTVIRFSESTGWDHMTYQGTASADLNKDNNSIMFSDTNGLGTIYNIKIYDSQNNILTWLPVAEGEGNILYDVTGNNNHGVIADYGRYVDYSKNYFLNGGFDSTDYWFIRSTWSVNDGQAFSNSSTGNYNSIYQDTSAKINKDYLLTYDLNRVSGTLKLWNLNQIAILYNGTQRSLIFKVVSSRIGFQQYNGFVGSLDNVYLYQIMDSNSNYFWNANTQDSFHYNLENGFSKSNLLLTENFESYTSVNKNIFNFETIDVNSFLDGKLYLDGKTTKSILDYRLVTGQKATFRFKTKINNIAPSSTEYFLDWRYLISYKDVILGWDSSQNIFSSNSGIACDKYINGIESVDLSGYEGEWIDVVFACDIIYDLDTATIGRFYAGISNSSIDFNSISIYNKKLDSDEILALYNGEDINVSSEYIHLPAKYQEDLDVFGNTLSNFSGKFHNGSETEIALPLAPELISADDENIFFFFNNDDMHWVQNDLSYSQLYNLNSVSYLSIDNSIENKLSDLIFIKARYTSPNYFTDSLFYDYDNNNPIFSQFTSFSVNKNFDVNSSIYLNGVNDFVYLDANSNISSISFWIKPNSLNQCLFSINNNSYIFEISSSGQITTNLNNLNIYINGFINKEMQVGDWYLIGISNINISVQNISLGKCDVDYYDGLISDLKLYTKNITQSQFQYLSNN